MVIDISPDGPIAPARPGWGDDGQDRTQAMSEAVEHLQGDMTAGWIEAQKPGRQVGQAPVPYETG